jgi:regulatory protein
LRKGFPEEEADAALASVRDLGLVDDGELLPRLVRHYAADRGYGPAKVAAVLKGRGFDPAGVAEALRSAFPASDEAGAAAAALRKKFRDGVPPGREGAARAYRFLAGRGFSPSACRAAIGRTQSENDPDSDTDEGEP